MHEIKKNIPLPASRGKHGRVAVYPFATMKDGECFDTPVREGESTAEAIKRMRTVSSSYRTRHKTAMAFTVRQAADENTGEIVVRVWARVSVPPVKRAPAAEEFFAVK